MKRKKAFWESQISQKPKKKEGKNGSKKEEKKLRKRKGKLDCMNGEERDIFCKYVLAFTLCNRKLSR